MTPTDPGSRLEWSTPLPALAVAAVGGVVLATAAVLPAFSSEVPSRVLIGLTALALLALAGLGVRQRPRLTIVSGTAPRLIVRGLLGPVEYSPDRVLRARVVHIRRLGRTMPTLEIDVDHNGDERLLIFGRWDLGAHPEDALNALVEQGFTAAR